MSLKNWEENNWLKAHKTSKQELDGLWKIVARELKDSQVSGLSSDGRFNLAYRAALTLATILLYSSGYRVASAQSHHYRTIDAITEILGKEYKDDVEYLQKCREKRNASEYDSDNEPSETETQELIKYVKEFEKTVHDWIKKK